jgi:hypothetical protein
MGNEDEDWIRRADQIEFVFEQSMDALFHELQNGTFTKKQYDMAVEALDLWVKDQYENLKRTIH